jgi:hypothetical protein
MVARTVVYGIGTPSNDTVSTAKIVDGAVTPAKLSLTYATETFVGTAVSNLVDSSPAALDTLNELAAALGDDPNFATTVTNSIALKAPLASPSFTGDVGIGVSPSSEFHVKGDANTIARVEPNNNSGKATLLVSSTASGDGGIQYDANNNQTHLFSYSDMTFNVGTGNLSGGYPANERMRISSAGRVGINTTDIPPNSWLTVEGGTYDLNQYTMHLRSYTPSLVFQDVSTAATDFEIQADNGGLMFRYGDASTNVQLASEAMRISGGNLLVGKSVNDLTTDGIVLRGSGELFVTRANDVAAFNRRSSDGNIVTFRRDGSSVGSIGVGGSRPYFANSINFSIKCDDANSGSLVPANQSGVPTNNVADIGLASNRWNDLYLGGGVYLGGTGAANKLDDYETGTWTPNIKAVGGTTSAAFSSVSSTYTKVGRLVTVNTYIYNINYSGITDGTYIVISNLPFAAGDNYGGSCLAYANGNVESVYLNRFTDYAYLCNDTNGNEFLQNNTNPTTTKFMATIIYQTA